MSPLAVRRVRRAVLPLAGAGLGLALACATPQPPPAGASGSEIYTLQLCANCHGDTGEGRSSGPPLRALSAHWTRAQLANFLAHTERWERDDARIARLSKDFSGDMRGYVNLSLSERERLADWLLQL